MPELAAEPEERPHGSSGRNAVRVISGGGAQGEGLNDRRNFEEETIVKQIILKPGEVAPHAGAYFEIDVDGKATGRGLWRDARETVPRVPSTSKWTYVELRPDVIKELFGIDPRSDR